MDGLFDQQGQCASSILQITDALNTLGCDGPEESIRLLRNAKEGLVNTLIALLKHSEGPSTHSRRVLNSSDVFRIGSLVLAPRFSSGILSYDIAIVTKYMEPNSGNCDSEEKVDVVWLRPRSFHETNCTSRFSTSTLKFNGLELYDHQDTALSNVRSGDSVLFKNPSTNLWESGSVLRFEEINNIAHISRASATEKVMPPVSVAVIFDITNVTPGSLPSLKRRPYFTPEDPIDHECIGSDHNEGAGGGGGTRGIHNKQTSDNSYADAPRITVSFDTIVGLGSWERHTKGIGGKLMAKMGYKRGTGLGRHAQGVVVPIEGLLKPLPQGLSLDFISEQKDSTKKRNIDNISTGSGDIFSDDHRVKTIPTKNNSIKNSKGKQNTAAGWRSYEADIKNDLNGGGSMFGFLNSVGRTPGLTAHTHKYSTSIGSSSSIMAASNTVGGSGNIGAVRKQVQVAGSGGGATKDKSKKDFAKGLF